MGLRFRRLDLRISTEKGLFGVSLSFAEGLNIIRADNTSGKSTCIMSIIYALGLEGMFSPSHDVPLPPVMTKCVMADEKEIPVLESNVFLEISNHRGEVITIQRCVKGEKDTRLVTVWEGPALSDPNQSFKQSDFYVRLPGGATRTRGFHNYLASFVGWNLPTVHTFKDNNTPLYMECIFPLMVVEQKFGWSGLPARIPTYYGIRDVAKRAIEFLLSLDAYKNAAAKQQLKMEEIEVKQAWRTLVGECKGFAESLQGQVTGLAEAPVSDWPPAVMPSILVPDSEEWLALAEAIKRDRSRLRQMEADEIPEVNQVVEQTQDKLVSTRDELETKEVLLSEIYADLRDQKAELEAIDLRIKTLTDDLRKNQDVLRLQSLGSLMKLEIAEQRCPTCRQEIADCLITQTIPQQPMTLDENIAFLKEQIDTFSRMRKGSVRVIEANEKKEGALRADVNELRATIRSLKQTLITDGRGPSIAFLRERIKLDEQLRLRSMQQERFEECLDRFGVLVERWREIQQQKADLPAGDLSNADKVKLQTLQDSFLKQITEYGLRSVPPSSLTISEDNYKPVREGFDLGFDLSASDNIRSIWAYLCAFLETARTERTNHLGFLIFDEPRQQEADKVSFDVFLKRAAVSAEFGQQIIFATSAPEESLKSALDGVPNNYMGFEGLIIKRLNRDKHKWLG